MDRVAHDTAATQAGTLQLAWNGESMMKAVQAQSQITQAYSAQMPRQIAEYAAAQQENIAAKLKIDPNNAVLQSELAKWGEGGSYRIALHTISGAFSGGLSGAAGSLSVTELADKLNHIQGRTAIELQQAGISAGSAALTTQALAELVSLGVGGAVGGLAGAASALAADTNNRQLHPVELRWIGNTSKDFARTLSEKYGRTVSELEAMRVLTYAGASDVDNASQYAVSNILAGAGYGEEKQMLLDGKKFILEHANENFVDEQGVLQKLFVAKPKDFRDPAVYSEYSSNAAYRDFLWTVTGDKIRPSNPTQLESRIYDERESIRLSNAGKSLLLSSAPGILATGIQAGRTRVPLSTASSSDHRESIELLSPTEHIDSSTKLPVSTSAKISELGLSGTLLGYFSAAWKGVLPDNLAETFTGARYRTIILENDTILYRSGTASQPLGQFFSLEPARGVIPARVDQAILPNWPGGGTSPIDTIFAVKIPAGTAIHIGEVGAQSGFYSGGAVQIVVPTPWKIKGVDVISSYPIK